MRGEMKRGKDVKERKCEEQIPPPKFQRSCAAPKDKNNKQNTGFSLNKPGLDYFSFESKCRPRSQGALTSYADYEAK